MQTGVVQVGDDRNLHVNGIVITTTKTVVDDFKRVLSSTPAPFWCSIGAVQVYVDAGSQISVLPHVDGVVFENAFDIRIAENATVTVD